MKTWIISSNGKRAWNWNDPSEVVELTDADEFIRTRTAAGDVIGSDDRHKPGGNVWD